MADRLRFELRKDCSSPVFKTGAFNRSATYPHGKFMKMADGLRFELRKDCSSPVFKTGAFNRSATHPLYETDVMITNNTFFVNRF